MNNLYHCEAVGFFGRFGDWIWARTRAEAEAKFHNQHDTWPTRTTLERMGRSRE